MALADKSGDWYGCVFADEALTVDDHLDVAAYVQAASKSRIYGVTDTDTPGARRHLCERRREQGQDAGLHAYNRRLQPKSLRDRLRARPGVYRQLQRQPLDDHPEI